MIPPVLRTDMKAKLYIAHLTYGSMRRRASGTIFWPRINTEIKQIADTCEVCQELKPTRNKVYNSYIVLDGNPWEIIGTDLFEIKGRQYLMTVDYYPNFIEVDFLQTTTSSKAISVLKKQFREHSFNLKGGGGGGGLCFFWGKLFLSANLIETNFCL